MNFEGALQFVKDFLRKGLPKGLYYHSYDHTLDVLNAVTELAAEEKINEHDTVVLKTAAIFHDCGFVLVYENHEDEGCRIAREKLPLFGYLPGEIETVCKLIMKTKFPARPETHLEKILCDADLDYLGRDDFEKISNRLFDEWKERGKISSVSEWNELQVKFLEEHQYKTASAISKRETKKKEHLKKLKQLI